MKYSPAPLQLLNAHTSAHVRVCDLPQTDISVHQTAKLSSRDDPDPAALSQDGVPLTEMDKAAVLTLIREEVCRSHMHKHRDTEHTKRNFSKFNLLFGSQYPSIF